MPAVARVSIDLVGGAIIVGPGEVSVKVNGLVISVINDTVASHGSGPHAAATIVSASSTVFANGKAVVRVGDSASCGDLVSTGSPNVFAG